MVGQTALAVALGGVICPVPFVMPAAALRISADAGTRPGRIARIVALVTIAAQAGAVVLLATTALN